MYLSDYHSHSRLSPDGNAPLSQMADAAVAAGLAELCITDHCDLLDEGGHILSDYDWPAAIAQFEETAPRYAGRLTLKLGLEFGSPHVNPTAAERLLTPPQIDFVIGSVHNLTPEAGGGDFFYQDYTSPAACYAALDDYFISMARLAATDYYDVLGHVIYPLRYMPRPVPLTGYYNRIRGLLQTAVNRGKGIEVNTWRGRTVEEWRPILALYRECGGTIVTVGSDAHAPAHVAAGITDACALLRDMGFSAVATYEKRKPIFHKL